jgi:hypothetical protein
MAERILAKKPPIPAQSTRQGITYSHPSKVLFALVEQTIGLCGVCRFPYASRVMHSVTAARKNPAECVMDRQE